MVSFGQHCFVSLDWIHQIQVSKMSIIVFLLLQCNVQHITKRWVSVVVKIAGLLQCAKIGCIPSTTPLPETECFLLIHGQYTYYPCVVFWSNLTDLKVLSLKNFVNLIRLT